MTLQNDRQFLRAAKTFRQRRGERAYSRQLVKCGKDARLVLIMFEGGATLNEVLSGLAPRYQSGSGPSTAADLARAKIALAEATHELRAAFDFETNNRGWIDGLVSAIYRACRTILGWRQ